MLKKIMAILFSMTLCLSAIPAFATGDAVTEIPKMKVIFEVDEKIGDTSYVKPVQQLESGKGRILSTVVHGGESNVKIVTTISKENKLIAVDFYTVTGSSSADAEVRYTSYLAVPTGVNLAETTVQTMIWDENYAPVQEPAVITGTEKRIKSISGKDTRIFDGFGEIRSIFTAGEEVAITLEDPENSTYAITSENKDFSKGEVEITVTSKLDNSTAKYLVNPAYFNGTDAEQDFYLSDTIWNSENKGYGVFNADKAQVGNKYKQGDWYWTNSLIGSGNTVEICKDAETGNKYINYTDNSSNNIYLRCNHYYNDALSNMASGDSDYMFDVRFMPKDDVDLSPHYNSLFTVYAYDPTTGGKGTQYPHLSLVINGANFPGTVSAMVPASTSENVQRSTLVKINLNQWINAKALVFRNKNGAHSGLVYAAADDGEYLRNNSFGSRQILATYGNGSSVNYQIVGASMTTGGSRTPKGWLDYAVVKSIEE